MKDRSLTVLIPMAKAPQARARLNARVSQMKSPKRRKRSTMSEPRRLAAMMAPKPHLSILRKTERI